MYPWTALFEDPTTFVPGIKVVSPECPEARLVIAILPVLANVVIGLLSSNFIFLRKGTWQESPFYVTLVLISKRTIRFWRRLFYGRDHS